MRNLSDRQFAFLIVLLGATIGSAGPVFTKIALRSLSPEYFSFLRFLLSTLVLMPLFLKSGIKLNKETAKLVLISLLGSANILLFAHGIKTTTATIGQLLYVLSPVIVFIFSLILIKERATGSKILGVISGMLGAGIIILLPEIQKGVAFSGDLRGNLLIIAGVIASSLYLVLSKNLQGKFSPLQITMVFTFTTMFSMLVLSFSQVINNFTLIFSLSKSILFSIFYVGVVATAVFYLLQQYAVKHGSPLVSSTMLFLTPFLTIIWADLLLGEKLTSLLVVGGRLVLIGTYFILKSSKKEII